MSVRKCGFCKLPGHNRATCPSFISSEKPCLKHMSLGDTGSTILRSVGHGNGDCDCYNCKEYRKYNLPTPEIACQIIKDEEVAKELEKKENQFPQIIVKNETRTPIYIYNTLTSHWLDEALETNEQYTIQQEEPFEEPSDEGNDKIIRFTITDHDYGNSPSYSEIEPEHILKLLTMEYGTNETITITANESSKEDQWREAALKANYLLEQLGRLGVSSNPNYEPIMDMVQDIPFPEYGSYSFGRSQRSLEFRIGELPNADSLILLVMFPHR